MKKHTTKLLRILCLSLWCATIIPVSTAAAAGNLVATVSSGYTSSFNEDASGSSAVQWNNTNHTFLEFSLSPAAPDGSNIQFTTNGECQIFSGGGLGEFVAQGNSYSAPITNWRGVTVAVIDDSEYEGDHSCKVTGTVSSPDSAVNGATTSIKVTIKDNDKAPAKTTSPTKPTTAEPTKPAAIDTTTVKLDKELAEGETKVVYDFSKPVVISGKTIPGGVVNLYIFSDPKTATVTADQDGNWTYAIEGLEAGDHRVEAEVKDAATGLVSDRGVIATFAVTAQQAAQASLTDSDSSSSNQRLWLWLVGFVVLAALAAGAFFYFKRRKQHSSGYPAAATNNLHRLSGTDNTEEADTKAVSEDKVKY